MTRADAVPSASAKPRFRSLGRKDDLVEKVVLAIEGEIAKRRLHVGAKLPPEREFAERLGVSRTVVREAVRILVTKGLLETRHGIGTTVRELNHEQISKPLTLFLRTSGREITIEHLHQVRSMLEVVSAGLAAELSSPADVADLQTICAEMRAAEHDNSRFAAKDAEFHRRLSVATQNPLITLLLDSMNELMVEIRHIVGNQQGLYERVMEGHTRIAEAVAAKDPEKARTAMRDHLAMALEVQRSVIRA